MKRKKYTRQIIKSMILILFFLCIQKELKSKKLKIPTIINWAFEDNTPDDGWDFSKTWQKNRDKISVVNATNKNVKVSKKEYFEGDTSLKLHIRHCKNGYAGCYITTRLDNTGMPPLSSYEANQGKDISNCDTLEFWVKGEGQAKIKNVRIELVDSNELYTDKLILIDYISPGKQWKKVEIPLDEFNWNSGINMKSIKAVTFFVQENDPYGEYILYIDNMRFIRKGIKWKKRFKLVFEDTSMGDKAWNFSGIMEGRGTQIEKSAYYKSIPVSTNEKYKGFSSLKIDVYQNRMGWGYLWFTGDNKGDGVPPENWEDFNTPKDISPYDTLSFWIKGKGKCEGKLELSDINGHPTAKMDLIEYVNITGHWSNVIIPFKDIYWQDFDKTKFKEIKFIIDDKHPPGEFTVYIDNLEFIGVQKEKERFDRHFFNGLDCYYKEGYEYAVEEWEKALKIDPENENVKEWIKKAKKELKQKKKDVKKYK